MRQHGKSARASLSCFQKNITNANNIPILRQVLQLQTPEPIASPPVTNLSSGKQKAFCFFSLKVGYMYIRKNFEGRGRIDLSRVIIY